MSKKYFLFSALAIMLLVGFFDFIYAIYHLIRLASYSGSATEIVVSFVFAAINLGLCIPALVMTIKAFKNKENSITVPSVLALVATTLYFAYRIYSVTKMLTSSMYSGQDIQINLYYLVYAFGQTLIGLLPVALAILSLVTFKKGEQDYVPSQKINKIFFYIVVAFSFQEFLSFATTGIRGSLVLSYSRSTVTDAIQALIYLFGSLGIIGCLIPSFILSLFERKRDVSRNLLLIAAIIVLGVNTWSIISTISSAKEYNIGLIAELLVLQSIGVIAECAVIIVGIVMMYVKFKTNEPAQIKTELE